MAQTSFNAHREWIKSAEKAVREGNYESAARLFRYVSTYYGIIGDELEKKKVCQKNCSFEKLDTYLH